MTFNPSQDSSQPTTSTEPTTPDDAVPVVETPPTPTPAPTPEPTNNLLSAYSAVLGEKDREIARLRAEAEARNNQPAPTLSPEEQSKKFFETPLDLIRSEIHAAIKPLNEFAAQTKREQEYANLKSQMRQDPRFSQLSAIEVDFDLMMKNAPLDPNTMIGAYYAVLGMAHANGKLAAPAPTTPPAPAAPVTTPAHLRPSAGNVAAPTKPQRRQLTENEKRLARAAGMTDDQYLDELEGPATLIVGTK